MGSTNHKALIYDPYWDSMGGGEKYMASIAKVLLESGWSVDISWPHNISAIILKCFGIDLAKCNFVGQFLTQSYDLVFWNSDGSLPVSLAKHTFINMQYPHHGVSGHNFKNFIKSRFYTFLANSEFSKSVIDREYWIKSKVLYPPIRIQDFTPGPKFKQILYVGRFSNLTQSKGHAVLIESFKKISTQIPEWKLILVGNTNVGTTDENLDKLKKLASGLPVEFIINPDLNHLKMIYSRASIFWSASGMGEDELLKPEKVEHFGMTVVEAMSAGAVPVISNLGGHKEIISSADEGYLWNTPTELCKITLDLISNPKKIDYMSKFSQNRSKIFSEDKFRETLSDLMI